MPYFLSLRMRRCVSLKVASNNDILRNMSTCGRLNAAYVNDIHTTNMLKFLIKQCFTVHEQPVSILQNTDYISLICYLCE